MADSDKNRKDRDGPEGSSQEDEPKTPDLPPPTSPKPGQEHGREDPRRRPREQGDGRAGEAAPDDQNEPADEVEPEEPPD
ncbi:hypothetical protein [Streptomyces crystallinus]|uniref:Uncharacterized protein n=1 Tax=Streptomyces crystallinus TaxID=68191 RepID=A0ABP3QRR6_9ACTN